MSTCQNSCVVTYDQLLDYLGLSYDSWKIKASPCVGREKTGQNKFSHLTCVLQLRSTCQHGGPTVRFQFWDSGTLLIVIFFYRKILLPIIEEYVVIWSQYCTLLGIYFHFKGVWRRSIVWIGPIADESRRRRWIWSTKRRHIWWRSIG